LSVAIFQHLQRMEYTFHNSCVIIDIVPSAVMFLTELSCWSKGYSNKITLLIGWSHRYKCYGRHFNQVDRYEMSIYQMTKNLLFLTEMFSFLYHCQYFYRTWLYIWVTWSVSYKKQELLTLREYLCSPVFIIGGSVMLFLLVCCVDLLLTFWLPCCDLRFDDRLKRWSIQPHLKLFVGGFMSYLRYWCLLVHSGVQHILCCVCGMFIFVFCTICC
jgi:hypothetical protein